MMTTLHGWQPCRACHETGHDLQVAGEWQLRANPGYWGSSQPRVLVLGFSKGATQIAAATAENFDRVAFAGMRPRLRQVLDALGIDLGGQDIDEALTAGSRWLGAASLIRCGLSLERNGKLEASGTIMPKAAKAAFTRGVMSTCVQQHLKPLQESVTTVVLLGTTDAYIKGVKALMGEQFPDYRDLNEVAFTAQGRTWIFAAHPSPANGEFKHWLAGNATSTSGRKRGLALQALGTQPPTSTVASVSLPAVTRSPALIDILSTKECHSMPSSHAAKDRFAETFHLVRYDGRKVAPVMMKNRDTGRIAFRVAKIGNTKDSMREVTDETELLRYCESGQYHVRAQPVDKSAPPSFIRPLLNHRIVKHPAG